MAFAAVSVHGCLKAMTLPETKSVCCSLSLPVPGCHVIERTGSAGVGGLRPGGGGLLTVVLAGGEGVTVGDVVATGDGLVTGLGLARGDGDATTTGLVVTARVPACKLGTPRAVGVRVGRAGGSGAASVVAGSAGLAREGGGCLVVAGGVGVVGRGRRGGSSVGLLGVAEGSCEVTAGGEGVSLEAVGKGEVTAGEAWLLAGSVARALAWAPGAPGVEVDAEGSETAAAPAAHRHASASGCR